MKHFDFDRDDGYGFHQHNDVEIVLRMTDRRGHKVRANMVQDLKVKVWTQDPGLYLAFSMRQIEQERLGDVLRISEFQMDSLPAGVISYTYSFREFSPEHRHGVERVETVTTDIKWRPAHIDQRPANPINYMELERIQDLIERVDRECKRALKRMGDYISLDLAAGVKEEIDRVTRSEETVLAALEDLRGKVENGLTDSVETASAFLREVQSLRESVEELRKLFGETTEGQESSFGSFKEELDGIVRSLKKELAQALEDEADRAKKEEKNLSEAVSSQEQALRTETGRAKGEEERIEARVETLKKALAAADDRATEAIKTERRRAKREEERIDNKVSAETSRAQLVEKDLAESMQALKQTVNTSQSSNTLALEALKVEMREETDKRIRDLIGTAPEALDTLGEIAEQLSKDDDAIKALNGVLSGKANADDVYRKEIIDSRLQDVLAAIEQEKLRRELETKKNSDAIAVINGDENTIGSIAHAMADCKHYTDDKVHGHADEVTKDLKEAVDSIQAVPVSEIRKLFSE